MKYDLHKKAKVNREWVEGLREGDGPGWPKGGWGWGEGGGGWEWREGWDGGRVGLR